MVQVVSLSVDRELAEDERGTLLGATAVYVLHPNGPGAVYLAARGISCVEIPPNGVGDGAALALFPSPLDRLREIADRLLAPDGCPWDREQTHASLKRHLLEEAYEVIEAIDEGSKENLREELGDLLLQPIMHAEMERVAGTFDIDDVATDLADKLVRRHPHVFGTTKAADADEVLQNWDAIKQSERPDRRTSALGGVPRAMPALLRAFELSKRASRTGFEWPDLPSVFDKLREEEAELHQAMRGGDPNAVRDEIGDLLFTVVQIARWLKVEPEDALRIMTDRFISRFEAMESQAEKPLRELTFDEWDGLWERSKNLSRVPS